MSDRCKNGTRHDGSIQVDESTDAHVWHSSAQPAIAQSGVCQERAGQLHMAIVQVRVVSHPMSTYNTMPASSRGGGEFSCISGSCFYSGICLITYKEPRARTTQHTSGTTRANSPMHLIRNHVSVAHTCSNSEANFASDCTLSGLYQAEA